MDRADPQRRGERGEPGDRSRRGLLDDGAPPGVAHRPRQLRDDVRGPAQVPLRRPVEAGVLEPGQRAGEPGPEPPEVGDDDGREVARPGERRPLDEGQQADADRVVAVGDLVQQGAVDGGQRHRRDEVGGVLRQVEQGGVLGRERVAAPATVGDLEDHATVSGVDQDVAVLLAAQLAGGAGDAVQLVGESDGAGDVDRGSGGHGQGGCVVVHER